jgi:AcrR family transcriptional regulator
MSTAKQRVRTRLDADVRREQILANAARLISQRGYNGFSVQELAQQCGLTNAGLLYYFGSKEGLLIALLEDRDRHDKAAVTTMAGLSGKGEAPKRISLDAALKLFSAMVKRNSTQPELVRLYTVLRAEALSEGHPAQQYFVAREDAVLESFTKMVTGHVQHPRSTARQLMALMTGLQEQWLRGDHDFDMVTEWDRGAKLLLRR